MRPDLIKAQGPNSYPLIGHRLPFAVNEQHDITQGPRCDPPLTHNSSFGPKNEEALDITLAEDTDIYASEAGTVVYGGAGEIYIDHANGLRSVYAHLNERSATAGSVVIRGQLIGKAGDVNADSVHLHYSIVDTNSGVEIAVPIYFMPGLSWDASVAPYPDPSGTCPSSGIDGYAMYPPPHCGTHSPGQNGGSAENWYMDEYAGQGGQDYMGCTESDVHQSPGSNFTLQDFGGGILGDAAVFHKPGTDRAYAVHGNKLSAYWSSGD